MSRTRYQIRFAKTGLLRWTSHRDLMRLWERILRRCEFALSMTEGFHPKPRINFPSALALGIEGLDEVVELELSEPLEVEEVRARLAADDQPGLEVLRVCRVPEGHPKAQLARGTYEIAVPPHWVDDIRARIDRLRSAGTLSVQRKDKRVTADLASQVPVLEINEGKLVLVLEASRQASLKPTDLLAALELERLIEEGEHLTRTRVALENEIEPVHCRGATTSNASTG